MSKTKKIFSLLSLAIVGLLFISGPVFAGENSSGKKGGGLEKAREVLEEKLIGQPGIAGIGHLEDEGVITVFLENEQAKGKVPDRFEDFPVRKVVTGRFQILSGQSTGRTEEVRPLVGGISLSSISSGRGPGTLGMGTYNNKILSCAHVIAMDQNTWGFLTPGTPVIQPGIGEDGGTLANKVGVLEKYIPITLNSLAKPNYADAAIAGIDPTVTGLSGVQFDEGGNYQVSGTTTVAPGDTVRKSGRTTGITTSTVFWRNVNMVVYFDWPTKWAYFKDLIVVNNRPFAQYFIKGGDSGACVDKGGKFVGLAFATNQGDIYALICKASYIISGLGISVGP